MSPKYLTFSLLVSHLILFHLVLNYSRVLVIYTGKNLYVINKSQNRYPLGAPLPFPLTLDIYNIISGVLASSEFSLYL